MIPSSRCRSTSRRCSSRTSLFEARLLGDTGQTDQEFLQVERFGEIVGRPVLHGLDGGLDRSVGRHQDEGNLGIHRLDAQHQLGTGHPRHPAVAQDQIHLPFPDTGQRLEAVSCQEDLVPLFPQKASDQFPLGGFVIHHDDPERVHRKGHLNVKPTTDN